MPVMERRVKVEMKDFAFVPASLDVKVGETIYFDFTNTGQFPHDAFIGDKVAQDAHEKEMRAEEGHHHHHDGVVVEPGQKGEFKYRFEKPGQLEMGCHQKGHYDARMILVINVGLV